MTNKAQVHLSSERTDHSEKITENKQKSDLSQKTDHWAWNGTREDNFIFLFGLNSLKKVEYWSTNPYDVDVGGIWWTKYWRRKRTKIILNHEKWRAESMRKAKINKLRLKMDGWCLILRRSTFFLSWIEMLRWLIKNKAGALIKFLSCNTWELQNLDSKTFPDISIFTIGRLEVRNLDQHLIRKADS